MWMGRGHAGRALLRLLDVPGPVHEVVVQGEYASVIEDDGSVLAGDDVPPPLVVDSPLLSDDGDSTGGFSRESNVDRMTTFVCAYVYGAGAS